MIRLVTVPPGVLSSSTSVTDPDPVGHRTLGAHGSRGEIVKKLVKFGLIVGGIALAAKLVSAKKSEWQGLTESEVRQKLDSRLPDRVPEQKRAAVADKVVSKMRTKGLLRDEEAPSPSVPADGDGEGPVSGAGEADEDESTEDTESV